MLISWTEAWSHSSKHLCEGTETNRQRRNVRGKHCSGNMKITFSWAKDWCQYTGTALPATCHKCTHLHVKHLWSDWARAWRIAARNIRLNDKWNKTDMTRNSGRAIVLDSMSLEGWMGKLARLARRRGRRRRCSAASGGGCWLRLLSISIR